MVQTSVPDMITSDSLIDALGGTKFVAAKLGVSPSTVSCWRERGIPSARWLAIVELASELGVEGVTLDALARLGGRA
ncbi:carph-isopro domain-containing protein [Bradyrhizobium sp. SZCCHNR2032]|uniref:carph-isopro domain-containing protein n=2 Tax=unclassified Bradyrhizobium TaxID=2631580 RepID=UPI0039678BF2